ncbi:hypothetical protein [Longivirga aurantiaca]|uniref:Uncharacterized protein n=1 Tax=Longivirga aurantiaca TaxID=1837743 RepID=A0ABW1SWE2_9ACTN
MTREMMQLGTVAHLVGGDAVDLDDLKAREGADVGIVGRRWSTALRADPAHTAALRPSGRPAAWLGSLFRYSPGLSDITAFLANQVRNEALSGLAAKKVGSTHNPAGPVLEGLR